MNSPARQNVSGATNWLLAPASLRERFESQGRSIQAKRGQMILEAGDTSDNVYMVQSGRVRVNLFPMNGREVLIRDLGEGEVFGELAPIDGGRRSASIVALEATTLIAVPGGQFREAVTGTPEAALWFAGHLTRQIRNMTDRVLELQALNVSGRLHCQLLRLAAEAGVSGNRALISPAPTHDTLSAAIGAQRESVTRELGYLASIGLLEQDRRQLHVLDVSRLASIVRDLTGDESPSAWLDAVPVDQ